VGLSKSTDALRRSDVSGSLPNEDTVWLVRSSRAVGRAAERSSPRRPRGAKAVTGGQERDASDEAFSRRRQLSHDIRHELATIMLLASLLEDAPDVGADSRQRARQILGEARWLDRLQRAYDATFGARDGGIRPVPEPVRLDLFAQEAVTAIRLSTSTTIRFSGAEAWMVTDPLAFWRALRNMVGNAVRAAGSRGLVEVCVAPVADRLVIQVDDDGPGFGAVPARADSLGLQILRKFAADWGGDLEICRSDLGGCRVRLTTRAASPVPRRAETECV
jgi:signal transduction histidine kinase